jgi:hypothetical protein
MPVLDAQDLSDYGKELRDPLQMAVEMISILLKTMAFVDIFVNSSPS